MDEDTLRFPSADETLTQPGVKRSSFIGVRKILPKTRGPNPLSVLEEGIVPKGPHSGSFDPVCSDTMIRIRSTFRLRSLAENKR